MDATLGEMMCSGPLSATGQEGESDPEWWLGMLRKAGLETERIA